MYRCSQPPYSRFPPDGDLSTLKLYWQNINKDDSLAELPWLALLLLDIKPHAADPEKTFSLMGWYHSARRSQLASKTTTAMTQIKICYNNQKTRDSTKKPDRDMEMIMMAEQKLAGNGPVTAHFVSKTLAAAAKAAEAKEAEQAEGPAAAAQPASTAADTTDLVEEIVNMENAASVGPNEPVELASTAEVLDLFSSYYAADIADAQASDTHIVKDRIDTVVDFKSKALDPNYVSQPGPNPLEHTQGDDSGAFDVSQFVASM